MSLGLGVMTPRFDSTRYSLGSLSLVSSLPSQDSVLSHSMAVAEQHSYRVLLASSYLRSRSSLFR